MTIIKANGAGDQSTGFYNGVATQSLRLNRASNADLTRTQVTGTSRRKWTLSVWVKRSSVTNGNQVLIGAFASSYSDMLRFLSDDRISVDLGNAYGAITVAKFRDVSAWYHVHIIVDATQSSNDNKVQIRVNGVLQTLTGSYPADQDYAFNNNNIVMTLGGLTNFSNYEFDGYMSEFNYVDGATVAYTNFGETKNGIWIAKEPEVSDYGNNGFRLQFANTGEATTSEGTSNSPTTNIGDDSSGSGHNFAVNNIDDFDCVPDSPENNFCTMNSNANGRGNASSFTEGNLKIASAYGAYSFNTSTFRVSSGKWYWEMMANDANAKHCIGISGHESINTTSALGDSSTEEYSYTAIGQIRATSAASGLATYGNSDIIGVAMNLEDNQLQFFKNGSSITTISITAPSATTDGGYGPAYGDFASDNTGTATLNCGQDPSFAGVLHSGGTAVGTETPDEGAGVFKYSVPTGFKALCLANISDDDLPISPAKDTQAVNHFGTLTYTGNTSGQTIQSGGANVGGEIDFSPNWVWTKARSTGIANLMYDTNRGATKYLQVDSTNSEGTGADSLTDFTTNGFIVGADSSTTGVNNNGTTYVAWNWKAGGSASTIAVDSVSSGVPSIASSVSANTTAGFSIVTYTGTGSAGTIGHGLGKKPEHIIFKSRTENGTSWANYVGVLGAGKYLALQSTQAENSGTDSTRFNNTEPDINVFSVGTHVSVNTSSSHTYVAYCFAEVEGYSRFGSYTGNGDNDGTFVHLGFRPTFIMTKRTNSTSNWVIQDSVRQTFNPSDAWLRPNDPRDEGDTSPDLDLDFVSNGFKIRNNGTDNNINGSTYIYMAFAETPFKFANAR